MDSYIRKRNDLVDQIKKLSNYDKNVNLSIDRGNQQHIIREKVFNKKVVEMNNFIDVINLDTDNNIVYVEANITIFKLTQYLISKGKMLAITPEFQDLTVAGLINGAGLESSSYKHGQFNDVCVEYDIVCSNGDIIKASKKENTDLFFGIVGSFGTIGILSAVKLKVVDYIPYVDVVYKTYDNCGDFILALNKNCGSMKYDFIEGIISNDKVSLKYILCLGRGVCTSSSVIYRLNMWYSSIYFDHIKDQIMLSNNKKRVVTYLTSDYLFRHDKGAFWMGKYLRLFRLNVGRFRITDKILSPFFTTKFLYNKLHKVNQRKLETFLIQDYYLPLKSLTDFLSFVNKYIDVYPIWICPIKNTTNQFLSPNFGDGMFVDVGIYGRLKNRKSTLPHNILLENEVFRLKGRKMLYALNWYGEDFFWKIYDKVRYFNLRNKYTSKNLPTIEKLLKLSPIDKHNHLVKKISEEIIKGPLEKHFLKAEEMNNFLDINIHERFLVVQPFIKLTELLYVNLIFDLKIPVDINNENVTVLDAIFGVNGVKNIITKNIVAFEAVSSRGEVVNFSKAENPSLFVDFSSLPREICTITKLKLIF